MNYRLANTLRSIALGACALTLVGCFNNMSGLDEGSSTKSSQSNGATLNDSGFANETGPINTLAVLIGSYNDSIAGRYGILIDIQKSLLTTLGGSTLQTILDSIDSNTAMQARSVVIHLPPWGIKLTTTLGKLAAGNNKKLRNILNIRPGAVRIDLTTSGLEVPAAPGVLQLRNSNKTVITYGGKIESDYVRRMTVLIPFAGANASYLPSAAVPTYGDGYPAASPNEYAAGAVKLVRVTASIAGLFGNLITKAPYGQSLYNSIQSDAIKSIIQTSDSLAMAIHYYADQGTGLPTATIEAAYFININPANNSGPETFPFCHIGYDSQDQTATFGANNENEVDFSHPLACHCTPAKYFNSAGAATTPPPLNQFTDPCPTLSTNQKPALIVTAAQLMTPAPTSGSFPGLTLPTTLNDFTISAE